MFDAVRQAISLLREAARSLDVSSMPAADAVTLVEAGAEAERLGAAIRTLAARRVEETNVWRAEGYHTPGRWLAATTKTPLGSAIATFETARRLEELPATREALAAGRLTEYQTREIASAAAAAPEHEARLLEAARTQTLGRLREECRRVAMAASPDERERYRRIHAARSLRHWTDAEGVFHLNAELTCDAGAQVAAALEARRERIMREAHSQGRRERLEAYAADALVELAAAGGRMAGGPRAMVHVRVDHAALVRGHTRDGEVCEIPGIGPIPVAVARSLSSDSILKVLVTKGADICAVAHAGRTIPARLRTLLEERDPTCAVPGCDVRVNLQFDHRKPVTEGGITCAENIDRLCPWHHYLKTFHGYRLEGERPNRIWVGPELGPPGRKRRRRRRFSSTGSPDEPPPLRASS